MNPTMDHQPDLEEILNTKDEEWHIESDWDPMEAVCGAELSPNGGVPASEVPDSITCPECLSISNSVVYRFITSPALRLKRWLVG